MSAVDFNGIEACLYSAPCGIAELLYDRFDLGLLEGTGRFAADLGGLCGGGYRRYSGTCGGSRCSSVVDLHGNKSAFVVDSFCQLVKLGHEHVMIESELACTVGAGREIYADILYDDEAGAARKLCDLATDWK